MEKRIVTFGLLSLAIMLSFAQLQVLIFGRPEPVEIAQGEVPDVDGENASIDGNPIDGNPANDADAKTTKFAADSAATEAADAAVTDSKATESESDANANPELGAPQPKQPPRYITLGSVDPTSGHRMLVTFTNVGAAVVRLELSNPRYRDLDDKSGYLGHLLGEDDSTGGVRVNAVGAGTPAATAQCEGHPNGLRGPTFTVDANGVAAVSIKGDLIVGINGATISSNDELELELSKTKPGQTATVDVDRGGRRLTFTTTLTDRPLEVIRPEPLGLEEEESHPLSFLTTFSRIGERTIALGKNEIAGLPSMHNEGWATKVNEANHSVEFSRRLTATELKEIGGSGSLELVKRYRLPTPGDPDTDELVDGSGYLVDFDLEIRNTGSQAQRIAFQQDGPTGLPLEGWWYINKTHPKKWSGAGARDVVWCPENNKRYLMSCNEITSKAEDEPENPDSLLIDAQEPVPMNYVGCDTQYFAAVLMPRQRVTVDSAESQSPLVLDSAVARPVGPLDTERKKRTDVSFRLRSTPTNIEPGGTLSQELTIFAGPKERKVLDQFGLGECIVYGYFGAVSKPLVWILHFLYSIFRNYGIAIILLTVGVRGLMFPFGRKMARNAQKMQELAPEMKRIADKYKNDLEKRSQAQRDLFAKHNYNPLGGCSMMFFQLPIFLGLYRGLSTDIQLRQAPLIPGITWCSNLAGPDFFLDWSGWMPAALSAKTGWLGPYMNVSPFVTCILFMLHQKLFTPPPQDEQQQMQQSIMKVMMLFMGVMFHKVAAGLCVYFIASSLWGLGERLLLPKPTVATAAAGGGGNGGDGGDGKSSGGGFGGLSALADRVNASKKAPARANGAEKKKERKKNAKAQARKKN